MNTQIVEVTNGPLNWGKFLVGQFDVEWDHRSVVSPGPPLLSQIGHDRASPQVWVFDLQTCEGAMFRIGGLAKADLQKHMIWVCPMFEPFLVWLYAEWKDKGMTHVGQLPPHIDLPNAPFAMHGHRREGRHVANTDSRWLTENPALYEAAKLACHDSGIPWTDPRTGVTHLPPAKKET